MFVWREGQEFHLGDPAGWNALQLGPGMVIEVLLKPEATGGREGIWAGLLVTEVHVAGHDNPYINVFVKSLGCPDPEVSKQLSSWFNRRAGYIHLCSDEACTEESECLVHVTQLKTYSPEGFRRDYMSATVLRQLKKWLEDLGLDDPENRPTGPTIEGAGEAGRADPGLEGELGDFADGKTGLAGDPPVGNRPAPGDLKAVERARLRERLARTREVMAGRVGARDAGKVAVHPKGVGEPIDISSSEGYSPSVEVKLEEKKKKREKKRVKHRPLDPAGPGRALVVTGQELRLPGGAGNDPEAPKKKKKGKEKAKPTEALEEVSNAITTGNLQKQLMVRAAEAAEERRERKKKEKKHNKDPGKQLAQILTKVVGQKKKKKDKKKKRKKRGGGYPGGSPGGSSGSSQTSSSREGSGSGSEEEESSSSDSGRMQPPLKKMAIHKPGSVLKMLIDHARERLDQTAKVTVARRDDSDATQGVRISSYFQIVVKPQLSAGSPQLRELHMLSQAVDLLRSGELDSLGDLLASRFISLHQAGLDGHWGAARHLELIPYEETTAAGPEIVLKARKHARLAAQVAGAKPSNWKGGAKGKTKTRAQWEDASWQGDGKGRGKKGDKGRGRGKGGWKGQGAQEPNAETRQREKAPEK